jgi:ABC-type polysaccharide/polyol phosphate transport system ATPase subunit
MPRWPSLHHAHDLPDDVLVSVQGVTRAVAPPDPELPQWLARLLPKSGLAGMGGMVPEVGIEDDVEEEDDLDVEEDEEPSALKEISFELRRGEGLGILGPDRTARRLLLRILTGAVPPTTGIVVVRGRIAPVLRSDLVKLSSPEAGQKAVFLAARFLHLPQSLLSRRWREILEFAKLDDLADLEPRKYRTMSTARLLLSAALHLDVDVYLLDDSVNSDAAFAVRCFDLLEQRQREGAAVIQVGSTKIENLARLCGEVMWLEEGGVAHRGRPVDVAVAIEKMPREEKLHPLSAPLAASLAEPGEVEVPAEGATVDLELHVLRKNLAMTFALQLTDRNGRQTHLEQEPVRASGLGLYRLRIFIPGGLLPDGTYEAKLLAELGAGKSQPAPARELLTFDLVSSGQDAAEAGDDGLTFELLLDADDEEGEGTLEDVEWRVSRASS